MRRLILFSTSIVALLIAMLFVASPFPPAAHADGAEIITVPFQSAFCFNHPGDSDLEICVITDYTVTTTITPSGKKIERTLGTIDTVLRVKSTQEVLDRTTLKQQPKIEVSQEGGLIVYVNRTAVLAYDGELICRGFHLYIQTNAAGEVVDEDFGFSECP